MYLLAQETCPRVDDIRFIPLNRGLFAKVSARHYVWLMQWQWTARWNPHTRSFYAYRRVRVAERNSGQLASMARVILGLDFGDKRIADHKNHDTLDNTDGLDGNLRIATKSESLWNCRKPRTNTSGFKGVSEFWIKGKLLGYQAKIRANGKQMHLGIYPTKELAYKAYCEAAQRLHGAFACVGEINGI